METRIKATLTKRQAVKGRKVERDIVSGEEFLMGELVLLACLL